MASLLRRLLTTRDTHPVALTAQDTHIDALLADWRVAEHLDGHLPVGAALDLEAVLAVLRQFGRVELLALDTPAGPGEIPAGTYTCSLLGRGDADIEITSAAVWPLVAALGCLRDSLTENARTAEQALAELDAWRAEPR